MMDDNIHNSKEVWNVIKKHIPNYNDKITTLACTIELYADKEQQSFIKYSQIIKIELVIEQTININRNQVNQLWFSIRDLYDVPYSPFSVKIKFDEKSFIPVFEITTFPILKNKRGEASEETN